MNTSFLKKILAAAFCCSLVLWGSAALAQEAETEVVNVEFTPEFFPNDKDGLKDAQKKFKKATNAFIEGKAQEAMPLLEELYKYNPDNAEVNYMIATIYKDGGATARATPFYERAAELAIAAGDAGIVMDSYFWLGSFAHSLYNFDDAIAYFGGYKDLLANTPQDAAYLQSLLMIEKKLLESYTGKELKANPERVFIDNLGDVVNTTYDEYSPVITADASEMYYTACRPDGVSDKMDNKGKYGEDIWITERERGVWTKPALIQGKANTDKNDAVVGMSGDGSILYAFTSDNGGDISFSKKDGREWTAKKNMGKTINTQFHESSGSLSSDGKTFYFVSDRETPGTGGKSGMHDIFYSILGEDGKWQPAVNLGAPVNSPYDEISVFIHPNGTTLYFSSNGHNTMGGYDIFKSEFVNGVWTAPVNMGYPVNTVGNDLCFSVSASGRHGFFASQREGGLGGQDLYQVTFLGEEKPPIYTSEDRLIAYREKSQNVVTMAKRAKSSVAVTLLKGSVIDAATQTPLLASIELTDNELGVNVATFATNSATGRYLVSLPSGKNYGVAVKADGYLFYSENIDISNQDEAEYQEIVKDIALSKIEAGVKVVLRNIFFETGKATLSSQSITELERLVTLLVETKKLRIEISGHTDNTGSAQTNKRLSEARAKAVVDYLVSKGIDQHRLLHAGYGPDDPIESNDTPEGRAINRRTEFKILENQ